MKYIATLTVYLHNELNNETAAVLCGQLDRSKAKIKFCRIFIVFAFRDCASAGTVFRLLPAGTTGYRSEIIKKMITLH